MPSQRINDLLNISPRFMRSTQLERDFLDPEALSSYIVTPEISNHLRRLGRSFKKGSSQRSWRITGDFGSGKSSFALVLANLLSASPSDLPNDIRPLRNELRLARNAPKLLPVLVTGSREALSTAILRALEQTLSKNIDGRKKLQSEIEIKRLLSGADTLDREAIAAIESVAVEIVGKGLFGGILLILDELGKFLEFAALHPERQDVYFLQQLGESADRSGDSPFYTVGLLHQGFSAYAGKLSDSGQREWEKVASRFEEIVFKHPLSQSAILLSSAIDVRLSKNLRGWAKTARTDMKEAIELGLYGPDSGKTLLTQIAPELYPLHSTILPVLTRFFRRFGQNERSLFSFLLSSEPYALQDFSDQEAGPRTIYRLSDFYDFAAHNFSHRLSGQSFRSHWNHIDAVIRSASEEAPEDLALLKTIGILNVIESPELSPTEETLALALGHPDGLPEQLSALSKRGIIYFRGSGGFALWPHTSVNLEQAFLDAAETISIALPIADVVRDRLDTRPIVARRHYIETGNLRYFSLQFITAEEFENLIDKISPEHPGDGVLMIVICETVADRQKAKVSAKAFVGSNQVVIAISSPLEALSSIALELERWHWVERQTPALKDDRFASEEVSRQIATTAQLLQNRIEDYIGIQKSGTANSKIDWYHRGKSISDMKHERSLQSFLSNICDKAFGKAPTIPNELVNRHSISSAAAAARQKLFRAMLECSNLPLLGLPNEKAPPEKSMYLSVLDASHVHKEENGQWQLAFPEPGDKTDPNRVRPALDAIIAILEAKPDARVSVNKIWNQLRNPPYGVRDGLIPIFLLLAFLEFESEIAIYEDGVFQPEVGAELIQRLVKAPDTFEFQLCRITGVRRELISKFAAVIKAEKAPKSDLLSIVRPLCLFVAELPEYVKQTDQLAEKTLALRKAIQNASEPVDLIFSAIPTALGFDIKKKSAFSVDELVSALSDSLNELRRAFPELQIRMARTILDAFDESGNDLEAWRATISDQAETVLVGISELDLRTFSLKLLDEILPEGEWLESMGSFLTRRPPSLWRDRDESAFTERVNSLARQFQRVYATCFEKEKDADSSAVRVSLTRRNGEEIDRVLRCSSSELEQIEKLKNQLQKAIIPNRTISLAAVSKLLWELMEETK